MPAPLDPPPPPDTGVAGDVVIVIVALVLAWIFWRALSR